MSVKEYKCPCCGGNLVFHSEIQKLHCPFCDNDYERSVFDEYEKALEHAGKKDSYDWKHETGEWRTAEKDGDTVYICPSCGGVIEAGDTTIATECPYCGSSAILPEQVSGKYKPDLVIPFKVGKKEAQDIYKKFCKGKGFLPRDFTDEQKISGMRGVYVPYWLFSCVAEGCANYEGTKVRKWKSGNKEYIQTDYYMILREGKLSFDHVPVDGSLTMDDTYMESIEPYNMEEAAAFEEAYLSGYDAEKYDVSEEECEPRANERIKRSFEDSFRKTADDGRYATVVPKESRVVCRDGKVKYALLPVWVMDIHYRGKRYVYMVNGQTGKIAGNFPVSSGLLIKRSASVFAGSAAVMFAILNIVRLILS